jgi:hypothetical protein
MKRIVSLLFHLNLFYFGAMCQCTIDYSQYTLTLFEDFNYTTISSLSPRWEFTYPWFDPLTNTCGAHFIPDSDCESNRSSKLNGTNQLLVDGDILTISAERVPVTTETCVASCGNITYTYEWLSGIITLSNPADVGHGIIEVRCKLPPEYAPVESGALASVWLFGPGFEYDIFEAGLPSGDDHNRTFTNNLHDWPRAAGHPCGPEQLVADPHPRYQYHYERDPSLPGLDEEFHTYTMVWTPNSVAYFFDGVELRNVDDTFWPVSQCNMDFMLSYPLRDIPANDLSGNPITQIDWEIDWVKIWEPTVSGIYTPFESTHHWQLNKIAGFPIEESAGYLTAARDGGDTYFWAGTDLTSYSLTSVPTRLYKDASGDWVHETISHTYSADEYVGGDLVGSLTDGRVYYRGLDGRLQNIYHVSGTGWVHNHIDATSHTDFLISSAPGSMSLAEHTDQTRLYYRGADDRMQYWEWDDLLATWVHYDVPVTYPSGNEISSNVVTAHDEEWIFYIASNGNVTWLREETSGWILSQIPAAVTPKDAYGSLDITPDDKHLVYRGITDRLETLSFTPGGIPLWSHQTISINPIYNPQLIHGDLDVSDYGQEIMYIGEDGKLNRIYRERSVWKHDWPFAWQETGPIDVSSQTIAFEEDVVMYRRTPIGDAGQPDIVEWTTPCNNLNPPNPSTPGDGQITFGNPIYRSSGSSGGRQSPSTLSVRPLDASSPPAISIGDEAIVQVSSTEVIVGFRSKMLSSVEVFTVEGQKLSLNSRKLSDSMMAIDRSLLLSSSIYYFRIIDDTGYSIVKAVLISIE